LCMWNSIRSSSRSKAGTVSTTVSCFSMLYTFRPYQGITKRMQS
jgi:hypothetical protein